MAIEIPFVLFAVLMPFVSPGPYVEVAGLTLSQPGLVAAGTILAKASLGVIASILLAATTTAQDLLLGLQRLRLPRADRHDRLVHAPLRRGRVGRDAPDADRARSRCFDARGPRAWRVLAQVGGALFIRSYERGERVHLAMLSRGYAGSMPVLDDG